MDGVERGGVRARASGFHFSGHGDPSGELLFEDRDGRAKQVHPAALADVFRILGGTIRCVVLNACYSEAQALAIAEHVDVVVGMSNEIDDDAAIAFAEAFYQALGYGQDAQTAFDLGRSQIRLAGLTDADVPTLLTRAGIDARRVTLAVGGGAPGSTRAPRATGSALHQIGHVPGDFTGRTCELDELLAKMGDAGVTITALQGMGGIGKTTLSRVLAHKLEGRFPDAAIEVDMQGTGSAPLSPATAMGHVIRAWHLTEKLPDDEAQLRAMYRSVLHGKSAILLFDNARDEAQVEPLLPPPGSGSVVIVTSRQRMALPGLHTLRLDTLPEGDAVKLLRHIAPRIDEAEATQLAKLCGYLPVALLPAGKALVVRVDLKPAKYIEKLRDAPERLKLDRVAAVFHESLALLEGPARAFWLRLGVMPADFDRAAAAAVGGIEAGDADEHLGELVRRSLLEWDDPAERYRMHDLARDYARAQLSAKEHYAAERCHAEHFVKVAAAASALYAKGGEGVMNGLHAFDQEWPHTVVSYTWAAKHAENDDAAATVCCDLALVAGYLFDLRQHPREKVVWLEQALAAARRLRSRADEGKVLGNLGIAYRNLGEPHKAIAFFEQDLAISRELGDRRGEGIILGNLGNAYRNVGHVQKAVTLHERRLAIARELGDRRGEGNALCSFGFSYALLGETQKAIGYFERALNIMRELGDRNGESIVLGALGNAYADLGETRKSIDFYEEERVIAIEVCDRLSEARASWNLGDAYAALGDLRRAVELMQVCVDFERGISHSDLEKDEVRVVALRSRLCDPLLPELKCPCGSGRPFLECHGAANA